MRAFCSCFYLEACEHLLQALNTLNGLAVMILTADDFVFHVDKIRLHALDLGLQICLVRRRRSRVHFTLCISQHVLLN